MGAEAMCPLPTAVSPVQTYRSASTKQVLSNHPVSEWIHLLNNRRQAQYLVLDYKEERWGLCPQTGYGLFRRDRQVSRSMRGTQAGYV